MNERKILSRRRQRLTRAARMPFKRYWCIQMEYIGRYTLAYTKDGPVSTTTFQRECFSLAVTNADHGTKDRRIYSSPRSDRAMIGGCLETKRKLAEEAYICGIVPHL
jgi:hypothetical protein